MNYKKYLQNISYEKIYYFSLLLFAFSLPLSRALISLFTILLPLIWLIEGNFKEKFRIIKQNKALLSFSIFLALTFISLLWTQNFDDAKRPIRLLSYFLVTFVIATSYKPKYTTKIINAFLAGMFISEIIAYGVFFEIWHFKSATPQNPSPFMLHLDYSVFLAFSSILLLNRLFSTHYNLKEKIFFAFFFITVTGNLFLTAGRTGQVALIIGIIVMVLLHFKFSFKSFIISLLIISSIYTTAYYSSSTFQKRVSQAKNNIEKVIMHQNFQSSWGIRAAYWITTFEIIKEHPFFGVGIGDYIESTAKELKKDKYNSGYAKEFMSTNAPHNQYLLILLQIGIIGLGVFIYFIYNFFTLHIHDKEIKEISILFGSIFFTACLADTFFLQQFTLALFAFFSGIFISYSHDTNIINSH
jgi:O-antigen ligase